MRYNVSVYGLWTYAIALPFALAIPLTFSYSFAFAQLHNLFSIVVFTMAQSSIILYDILTGGCFFTPKTNFKEWTYGVLGENVMPGAKLGTFIMEDGSMKTFKVLEIKKAVARMVNNSENGGKAWEPPVFLKRYVDEKVYGLLVPHHNKFMMNSPDLRAFILEKSKNAYRESLLDKSKKPNNLSTGLAATVDSMNTNAKTRYKRWPLRTQVATDHVVTTEMHSQNTILSSTDKHGRVTVQWTTGFIRKVHLASLSMYEIEWDTKPYPLFVRTTAYEVEKLWRILNSAVHISYYKVTWDWTYSGNDKAAHPQRYSMVSSCHLTLRQTCIRSSSEMAYGRSRMNRKSCDKRNGLIRYGTVQILSSVSMMQYSQSKRRSMKVSM